MVFDPPLPLDGRAARARAGSSSARDGRDPAREARRAERQSLGDDVPALSSARRDRDVDRRRFCADLRRISWSWLEQRARARVPMMTRITVGASTRHGPGTSSPGDGRPRVRVRQWKKTGRDVRVGPFKLRLPVRSAMAPEGRDRALVATFGKRSRGVRSSRRSRSRRDRRHMVSRGRWRTLRLFAGRHDRRPIERADVFPSMVGHMVRVGEDTVQLEHMLSRWPTFYEADVDAKVKASLH